MFKSSYSCRWLGVDKVFLRENGENVPAHLVTATQKHVDSGFLDLGTVPGAKHPNQNRWNNRCSQSDMAGAFSWIAFIDLDEFLILMEQCALLAFTHTAMPSLQERKLPRLLML
jgi:hypothetical protein